ncbi:MAG: PorP/SprF family type IX secretion system membrane protein [Chitinophagales bacterium]|nr:PorP/SprF family type IX secretion system membrane protein [Bacteroidota bacterium]MCB9043553.1 PorP/SprF family type IX secretion system membrane protein [Chitinophagales bacterium]
MVKNLLKKLLLLCCVLFFVNDTQAQDIHFSQFYASPLTLNPAMTGMMQGCYRGAVNYRNQYADLAPYNTVSGSFDAAVLRGLIGRRADYLGVGIMLFNDRAGYGLLNNFSVMGSVAYHFAFDTQGKHRLSLGFQGGYVQKSIDFSKLTFENQFDGTGFNTLLPNGESIEDYSFGYFDFRAGGLISSVVNKQVSLYLGAAMFHLSEPTEQFLTNDNGGANTLDRRVVLHGGANLSLSRDISLVPNFIYMKQGPASEINVGALFGYQFAGGGNSYSSRNNGSTFFLGLQYRVKDAFIPLIGLEYEDFRFGLSYDVNVSELKTATLGQGGVELSITYEMKCEPQGRRTFPPAACPRF